MRHEDISNLLLKLGIRSTFLGYHYLAHAIELRLENEEYHLKNRCKDMYADIARRFGVRPENVHRYIRTAVSHCWDYGNRAFLIEITPYPLRQKPGSGEFIDILYNHLKNS